MKSRVPQLGIGIGIERQADLGASGANRCDACAQVALADSLDVDGDGVGAGMAEVGRVAQRVAEHEVHVQVERGGAPQRLHHHRADGDVGDEMPVHDIHMQHARTGGLAALDLVLEAGEVGREQAGEDADRHAPMVLRMRLLQSRRCRCST